MKNDKYWVIIPAGGTGMRFGHALPKQYVEIEGKTVLEHSMDAFRYLPHLQGVVITHPLNDPYISDLSFDFPVPVIKVVGGELRFQSVANGLNNLRNKADVEDWILVHDAVRPCLHPEDLNKLITTLRDDSVGGILAAPVKDTLKRTDAEGRIIDTVDRSHCWHALTPQMFRYGVLMKAIDSVIEQNMTVTDDAQALQLLGYSSRVVAADHPNPKLTYTQDFLLIGHLLKNLIKNQLRRPVCIA